QEHREGYFRAISSPAGMAQVTAEGLAEQGKQFRKAIEEGDPAKAAQTVGGLTVNTGVMLEGAAPGGAAPPPAPALVTAEGVVMAGPAAAVRMAPQIPAGVVLMAAKPNAEKPREAGSESRSSAPDKRKWNEQEQKSAETGEERTGNPFYREAELFLQKEPG